MLLVPDKITCSSCDIEKNLSSEFFYSSKMNKYGFERRCKKCKMLEQKVRRIPNKEERNKKRREHYKNIKYKVKQWDLNSKANNKQKRLEDPEFDKKIKKIRSNYCRNRRKTDINYKLAYYLRNRVRAIIKKGIKTGSAVRDLGCSVEELKVYLEKQFQFGMSWDNYGKWHIDHIIPLSKFDLNNREDFLKACNYKNLQPLWAIDNLKKSNRLDKL